MFKVQSFRINPDYALTNLVYINKKITDYIQIKELIYKCETLDDHSDENFLYLNNTQRKDLNLALDEFIEIKPYKLSDDDLLIPFITLEIDKILSSKKITIKLEDIISYIKIKLNKQFYSLGQHFHIKINDTTLILVVKNIENSNGKYNHCIFNADMLNVNVKISDNCLGKVNINLPQESIFKTTNFNTESLGIGGLDKEFAEICRRAFMSRLFSEETIKQLGQSHIKGILLYGPPGCGKTLIARQIGLMLSKTEPKIVDGPSILNKYVGESEKNIRNLFAEAEEDQRNGINKLHIIIIDEIDSICKKRGMKNDSVGVGDTIVNQLLSKIDGVNSLNNILVIGMTNRKDLIDDALLRPGRFEIQIQIGLPDEKGRLQILNIHTKNMKENNRLDKDVNLNEIAQKTQNYTGAEIESVVKSACSFVMTENIDTETYKPISEDFVVKQEHFLKALNEVKPLFGHTDLINLDSMNYIIYSEEQQYNINLMNNAFKNNITKTIIGITGKNKSGKTALSIEFAQTNKIPFIKFVEAAEMMKYNNKSDYIQKVFNDALQSSKSLIIIDNLETLIGFVPAGFRFDSSVLQTLTANFNRICKNSEKGKLFIIVSTSLSNEELKDLGILNTFDYIIVNQSIKNYDELIAFIKEYNKDLIKKKDLIEKVFKEIDYSELNMTKIINMIEDIKLINVKTI